MKPVEPILTVELFPSLSAELGALLRHLTSEDWERPSACPGWRVKDLAAHLLGGNIGRLSSRRQGLPKSGAPAAIYDELFDLWDRLPRPDAPISSFEDLVDLIDLRNAGWVEAAKALSPGRLIEALALTDEQLYLYFKTLPAHEPAGIAVAWAGDTQSPNWFDIAREYTEKWLHQQHIREALSQPGLTERQWLFPVLDTFVRALPHTYRRQEAPEGAAISFHILGEAGGEWSLLRGEKAWALYSGAVPGAISRVRLGQDLAWRLFTKGVSRDEGRAQIQIDGDRSLGLEILNMVAIMA